MKELKTGWVIGMVIVGALILYYTVGLIQYIVDTWL